MVDELVDGQKATTDLDLDFISFNLDHDALRAKLIDAFRFTHKHDLEFLAVRIIVDILCKLFVNRVSFGWDIDRNPGFKINDIGLEGVNFLLTILECFK